MEEIQLIIIPIIFVAAFVRSAFGFGDALIAMPLLAFFLGMQVATPLVGLCAITYSILILYKNLSKVKFKDVLVLIITSAIGIPIGIYLLKESYEDLLKLILGIFIVLFSLFNLFKPKLIHLKNDKLAFVVGFISGILGGAYNTNGPPVVIYSALRRWEPTTFRATMQGYFLPTGFMIALGHYISGLWTHTVIINYLIVIPIIIIGVILGAIVNKKIKKDQFNNYIFSILLAIGLLLIIYNI